MKCWLCSPHCGGGSSEVSFLSLLPLPETESAAAFTALCATAEPLPNAAPDTIVPIKPDIIPPP